MPLPKPFLPNGVDLPKKIMGSRPGIPIPVCRISPTEDRSISLDLLRDRVENSGSGVSSQGEISKNILCGIKRGKRPVRDIYISLSFRYKRLHAAVGCDRHPVFRFLFQFSRQLIGMNEEIADPVSISSERSVYNAKCRICRQVRRLEA